MLRSGMLLGSLAVGVAMLAACTQRGVQDQGWIELDQHHAYHASTQGDGSLLLSVSTLHAAFPGDDGLSLMPEAREAFRTTPPSTSAIRSLTRMRW